MNIEDKFMQEEMNCKGFKNLPLGTCLVVWEKLLPQ
jgi:hypothetical protein